MKKQTRVLTVHKIEREIPHVRVSGTFMEGGSAHRSHGYTPMSFVVDSYDAPKVGQELIVTIETKR